MPVYQGPQVSRRVYLDGVDDMVTALRAAHKEANDAIADVGWRVADDFARDVSREGWTLGKIEGRNLSDSRVFTSGTASSVHLEARFGGLERFSGGASTSLLVRPYEFGAASGAITVTRRTKRGTVRYKRAFPRNTRPDGRVVFPLAKRFAKDMVSEIVAAVYGAYRIALGDPSWVKVGRRG